MHLLCAFLNVTSN